MPVNDGGPAFPLPEPNSPADNGMSLRDWMAGMALQGFASNDGWFGQRAVTQPANEWQFKVSVITSMAYQLADAMLAEREKEASDA